MKIFRLLTLLLFSAATFAQIPNGGFDSWTTMSGYSTPDGWDNMNALTAPMSAYTCTRGGSAGSSFILLSTRDIPGLGVVPGIVTCGTLDMTNTSYPSPKSGFAFTQRPGALTGRWQYMGSGADMGYISAALTRWDAASMRRDTIAYFCQNLFSMVMNWEDFTMPLRYFSPLTPDTAFITLSASGAVPVQYSYLYIDSLQFSGSAPTGINETQAAGHISIYPNPASDMIRVSFDDVSSSQHTIQLFNTQGEIVQEVSAQVSKEYDMDVSGLPKGVYIVRISSEQSVLSKRLLIL